MTRYRTIAAAIFVMAVLLIMLGQTGCVTQRHIREVQADISRVEAQNAQTVELMHHMDSLIVSSTEADSRLRADLSSSMSQLQRQLDMLLENYNELLRQVHEIAQREIRVINPSQGAYTQPPVTNTDPVTTDPPVTITPAKPAPECDDLYDNAFTQHIRSEYANAIIGFGKFIDACPSHINAASAHRWVAWCHYSLGNYSDAVTSVLDMETKFPDDPMLAPALFVKARSKLELERSAEAKEIFQKIIDDFPSTFEAEQAKDQLDQLN